MHQDHLEGLLKPWTAGPGINPSSVIDSVWSREFAGEVEVTGPETMLKEQLLYQKILLPEPHLPVVLDLTSLRFGLSTGVQAFLLSVRITQNSSGLILCINLAR